MRRFFLRWPVRAALLMSCAMPLAAWLGWSTAPAIPRAGAVPAAETPLPPMTPLPAATSAPPLGLPLESLGFGAEPHARRLAFAPDGSGDVVFSVGKTYLSSRTLFHLEATASGALSDTATALLALPEGVRGLPEVRPAPGGEDYIVGAVRWHDEAAARYAYADLYRVSADGTVHRSFTAGHYRINDFAAAPDGEGLAVLLADGRLLELQTATGATRTLATDLVTPAGIAAANLAWSPDGRALAVGSHPGPEGARLERIDVGSGRRTVLAELPGRHQPVPVFLPNGRLLVVLHDPAGASLGVSYRARLYEWREESGGVLQHLVDLTPVEGVADVVREFVLHPEGDRLLYRLAGAAWMVDALGGAPQRLSDPARAVTAGPSVARTQRFGDRVAWIERFEAEGTGASEPRFGDPRALVWRVHTEVLP